MNSIGQLDLISLFFLLGILAGFFRSDLKFSEGVSTFMSIFLLTALGLKGGYEVQKTAELSGLVMAVSIGWMSCLIIPVVIYFLLKNSLGAANAAALGASYGSVSAVTFVAGQSFLHASSIDFSGHMVAVMALMEIPAIVVALILVLKHGGGKASRSAMIKAFTGKSVILLLGGFFIGLLMNEMTWNSLKPVFVDSFKGILAIFLMDLGVSAQKQFKDVWKYKWQALLIGIALPVLMGTLGLFVAKLAGLSLGDTVLLATLVGSASYIAAPAAIRSAVPDANPALYVALPLGLTFPFNVFFGIHFYHFVASSF